jgi:transposase
MGWAICIIQTLLFRWFVGMEMDKVVWNHAVCSKDRKRLLNEEIGASFFARVLERARPFLSDEHFTVDGTLIVRQGLLK